MGEDVARRAAGEGVRRDPLLHGGQEQDAAGAGGPGLQRAHLQQDKVGLHLLPSGLTL